MSSKRGGASMEADTVRVRNEQGRLVRRAHQAPTRSSVDQEAELSGSGGDGEEGSALDKSPGQDVPSTEDEIADDHVAAAAAEQARRKALRAMEMQELRQEIELAKLRAQHAELEAAASRRQQELDAEFRAQERKQEEMELVFAVRKAELMAQERLAATSAQTRVPAVSSEPSTRTSGEDADMTTVVERAPQAWELRARPTLPKFSGASSDLVTVEVFVDEVNTVASVLHWDDTRTAIEARGMLSGVAASLCRVVGAKTSWKAMQEALLKRFAVKHADDHWLRKVTTVKQRSGEATADYLLRALSYETRCREAGGALRDSTVVRATIAGLRDELTRSMVTMFKPKTLQDLEGLLEAGANDASNKTGSEY